jgi:hypothetical protein
MNDAGEIHGIVEQLFALRISESIHGQEDCAMGLQLLAGLDH